MENNQNLLTRTKSFVSAPYFKWIMLALQSILVIVVGLIGKDLWYGIVISVIGVAFNLLVSYNISYGFLIGFVYAITNGVNAYFQGIYATFGFMIIMQAPMAIYSFIAWRKHRNSKQGDTTLKSLSVKQTVALVIAMAALGVASYFLLDALKSNNIIPDTIFFVFSISACVLLALRCKIAYVVTLLSGLGGTALWITQTIMTDAGISLAVFYAIVTVNSVIAIAKNYDFKRRKTDDLISQPNDEEVG